MSAMVKPLPVQEAYEDLLQRSLSRIPCDLGRLLYLASTRDYNTGNYHHDGLADRFAARWRSPTARLFTRLPLFHWKNWFATWRRTWNLPGKIQKNSCAPGSGWSLTASRFRWK